jgi:hypothetical protein
VRHPRIVLFGRGSKHVEEDPEDGPGSNEQAAFQPLNTSDSDIPRLIAESTLCCHPSEQTGRELACQVFKRCSATQCPHCPKRLAESHWAAQWPSHRPITTRRRGNDCGRDGPVLGTVQTPVGQLFRRSQKRLSSDYEIPHRRILFLASGRQTEKGIQDPGRSPALRSHQARPTSRRSRTAPQPTVRPVVVLRSVLAAALSRLGAGDLP